MRKYCVRKDNPDKVMIEDCIPAIIDKQTFEMAQRRNGEKNERKRTSKENIFIGRSY